VWCLQRDNRKGENWENEKCDLKLKLPLSDKLGQLITGVEREAYRHGFKGHVVRKNQRQARAEKRQEGPPSNCDGRSEAHCQTSNPCIPDEKPNM
jgi:hypothetical protein